MIVKALVQVRAGSQHVPRKNLRPFAGSTLLEIKIRQLQRIAGIDAVHVSSDDPAMLRLAKALGCKIHRRDPYYVTAEVPINEVHRYCATQVEADVLVFAHVTSPLISDQSIARALELYRKEVTESGRFDSVNTAGSVRMFLLRDGIPLNYDPKHRPRSQDLPAILAINSAVNVISRKRALEVSDFIGTRPLLLEVSELENIDIDTPLDFELAEHCYRRYCIPKQPPAAAPVCSVLDCTLRDGGYVNDWRFSEAAISELISGLAAAGADYIECGYLQADPAHITGTIFRDVDQVLQLRKLLSGDARPCLAVMINYGEYPLELLPDADSLPGAGELLVRVAFRREVWREALAYCAGLQEHGYDVAVNPIHTRGYAPHELDELLVRVSALHPAVFTIVDTLGSLRPGDAAFLARRVDAQPPPGVAVGFHAHNNLQLAPAHALELLALGLQRRLIIDSSLLGLGRGGGNLPTELLLSLLQERGKNCCLEPLLSPLERHLTDLRRHQAADGGVPQLLTALYGCHPGYAALAAGDGGCSLSELPACLEQLPQEGRDRYSAQLALLVLQSLRRADKKRVGGNHFTRLCCTPDTLRCLTDHGRQLRCSRAAHMTDGSQCCTLLSPVPAHLYTGLTAA